MRFDVARAKDAVRCGLLCILFSGTMFAQSIFSPFKFAPIDYPGAAETFAYGVNSSGVVVGAYVKQPFTCTGTINSSICHPGAASTQPYGVSDTRIVVGTYNGQHGFIPTPMF